MGARREWVGPSGGVVGTDIDERLLEAARSFVISENAAVPVTPLPTNNTDHTFDMPDWQPIPVP